MEDESEAYPARINVDLYCSKSMDSVATMATNVFGGEAGLTGQSRVIDVVDTVPGRSF